MNDYDKQVKDFMSKYGWTISRSYKGPKTMTDWDGKDHATYKVTIRKRINSKKSKTYSFDFHASLMNPNDCTNYSILSCLTKYDPYSIDDFISSYGYEIHSWEDAKRVEKIYRAVKKEYMNLDRLIDSEQEWEEFREIC